MVVRELVESEIRERIDCNVRAVGPYRDDAGFRVAFAIAGSTTLRVPSTNVSARCSTLRVVPCGSRQK
jgi:hypothetical protein